MYVNCAFTPFPYLTKLFNKMKFLNILSSIKKVLLIFLTTDLTPAHESLKNIEL